jgi:hypothetical protein
MLPIVTTTTTTTTTANTTPFSSRSASHKAQKDDSRLRWAPIPNVTMVVSKSLALAD